MENYKRRAYVKEFEREHVGPNHLTAELVKYSDRDDPYEAVMNMVVTGIAWGFGHYDSLVPRDGETVKQLMMVLADRDPEAQRAVTRLAERLTMRGGIRE